MIHAFFAFALTVGLDDEVRSLVLRSKVSDYYKTLETLAQLGFGKDTEQYNKVNKKLQKELTSLIKQLHSLIQPDLNILLNKTMVNGSLQELELLPDQQKTEVANKLVSLVNNHDFKQQKGKIL